MRLLIALFLYVFDGLLSFDFWRELLKSLFLLTILPLLYLHLSKVRFEEVGLSLNLKVSLRYTLAMLVLASPFMLYGATLPEFKSYYPLWQPAREDVFNLFLLWFGMLFWMFTTEFFFRGFLLFSFERTFGRAAILLQAIPYVLVHIDKPSLELPYSFFAGLVFGYVALRTRSVFPGFFAHWTGAVIFDILCLKL